MRGLSADRHTSYPPPLRPIDETSEIVQMLAHGSSTRLTDHPDGHGALIASHQSILPAAFTGRLVPQDPSDEPASALLARLRAAPVTPRRGARLTRRV